jgi:hypothetical protein
MHLLGCQFVPMRKFRLATKSLVSTKAIPHPCISFVCPLLNADWSGEDAEKKFAHL